MARRIIRRRRPKISRRVVVRQPTPAAAPLPQPSVREGSPILVATSNSVRNLVLPKLAMFDEISLAGIANSPDIALKMLIQERPDAVIIDSDFGGPLVGLDTARLMQRTHAQSAIIMLVPEIDPEIHHSEARRFGTSWSYIRKTTATRENLLSIALKSAIRGVQWIEPALSRPLAELWKVAVEARDLEARLADVEPVPVTTVLGQKAMKNSVNQADTAEPAGDPVAAENMDSADAFKPDGEQPDDYYEDEIAPGIDLKSTDDNKTEGINVNSVSIGHGGVGKDVNKVRRTR